MCFTDLVLYLTIFDPLSLIDFLIKKCQKDPRNTTLRHQDLEEHHRKIHAVILVPKTLGIWRFVKELYFLATGDGEHFCSGNSSETSLLTVYL